MINKPGRYAITAAQYHADPCPEPSLSSSIAKLLLSRSPYHAWHAHPRLNPRFEHETDDKFNLGSAAHDHLLMGGRNIEVCNFPTWQTKEAKAAKEMIKEAGKIPLLRHQFYQVEEMSRLAEMQMRMTVNDADAYQVGVGEQTIIWYEEHYAIWCRAKIDWMLADDPTKYLPIVYDHKTTAGGAHPNAFKRQLFGLGYDLQAAFYLRGLKAVFPDRDWRFKFTPQEVEPPHCLSVVELPPPVLGMAERKVEKAMEIWSRCLHEDKWPAYPNQTVFIDIPAWAEKEWLDREMSEDVAREDGIDLFEIGMDLR